MRKRRQSWLDNEYRKQKQVVQALNILTAAVNVVDMPTQGEVPGVDAPYTSPETLEPEAYNDNNRGLDNPELIQFGRTRINSDKEAEMGETLTDLTTEWQADKPNQKNTTFGMWSDSYTNANQFEDPDLKLGDKHADDSVKDTMEFPAVQPPYTDGIGQPNPAYEDVNRDTYNVSLHAQKNVSLQQGKKQTGNPRMGDPTSGTVVEDTNSSHIRGARIVKKQSNGQLKQANDETKKTINFQGIDISIEWPKGSLRTYPDTGYCKYMAADYGYIKGVNGADREELDCYVGDNLDSQKVFVIQQVRKDTKAYDEDKVMLGFNSEDEALDAYLTSMDGANFGSSVEINMGDFKNALTKATSVHPSDDIVKKSNSDKEGVALIDWPLEGDLDEDDPQELFADRSIPRPPETEKMKYDQN